MLRSLLAMSNLFISSMTNITVTRSSGPYGPFLLAPAEGLGPLAPACGLRFFAMFAQKEGSNVKNA